MVCWTEGWSWRQRIRRAPPANDLAHGSAGILCAIWPICARLFFCWRRCGPCGHHSASVSVSVPCAGEEDTFSPKHYGFTI
eukprot:scaffold3810_cov120-Isochrysis_galbana.AAC.3